MTLRHLVVSLFAFLFGCGYITVYVETAPPSDRGRFNIEIDGATELADAADRSVLSQKGLRTGSHKLSETAGTATDLQDFTGKISGDCDPDGRFIISHGDDKSCTITNTRVNPPPPIGPQRTAIILIGSQGAGPHPYMDKTATASIFYSSANPQSARSFYFQASYGQLIIVGSDRSKDGTASDIYGPYDTGTISCNFDAIALADPDIDYRQYDRIVVLANGDQCGEGGVASEIPGTYKTGEGTRQLTKATIFGHSFGDTTFNGRISNEALHEYGHTLGLYHAGAWYCGKASVAPNGCYGNHVWEPIDLVSQESLYAHPNSVHKERLGWLTGLRVDTAGVSGTYIINAYEDGNNNLKVLKIPRKLSGGTGDALGYYYLSYRRPTPPWDAWVARTPSYANGVAIHIDETGHDFDGALLDATPGTIAGLADIHDGALALNQTFADSLS
ncbi:MAG: hypothetical protein HYR63_14030 [Proteobacteria bacterium]|nr:hypothetical protein [Pseudomonadota bacterium]